MMKYIDSPNLNAPETYPTLYTRTYDAKRTQDNIAHNNWCFRCRLHSIIHADSNVRRYNLKEVDLIQHEEICVIELQKIVNYYNLRELSSFQVGLIISYLVTRLE